MSHAASRSIGAARRAGGVTAPASRLALMLVPALGMLTGCGLLDRGSKPPATTAGASVANTTTTLSPFDVTLPARAVSEPASSAVTAPSTAPASAQGLPSPQAASRNLYDAWRDDDRPRALSYATSDAVDVVFERPWAPDVELGACTIIGLGDPAVDGSLDQLGCLYTHKSDDSVVHVIVEGDSTRGYRVASAERAGGPGDTTAVPLPDTSAASTTRPRG